MSFFFLDPELYARHKDEVLRLSNSLQVDINEHLPAERRNPGCSDKEIAEQLGLEEHVAREIRVVAERDFYPIDEWQEAIAFKDAACRAYREKGVSYAMKKYQKK